MVLSSSSPPPPSVSSSSLEGSRSFSFRERNSFLFIFLSVRRRFVASFLWQIMSWHDIELGTILQDGSQSTLVPILTRAQLIIYNIK